MFAPKTNTTCVNYTSVKKKKKKEMSVAEKN